jgi:hypothetical protein
MRAWLAISVPVGETRVLEHFQPSGFGPKDMIRFLPLIPLRGLRSCGGTVVGLPTYLGTRLGRRCWAREKRCARWVTHDMSIMGTGIYSATPQWVRIGASVPSPWRHGYTGITVAIDQSKDLSRGLRALWASRR